MWAHTHTDFFLFSCYTHFDHMGLLRTIKQRLCSIYIVKYPIRKLIYFSFRHCSVKYLASYFRRMWSVQTILTFLNSRRAYMFRYIDKYLFSLSSSSFLVDSNETTDLGRRSGCLEELYTVAKSRSWIRNMKWCKTSPKITKICLFFLHTVSIQVVHALGLLLLLLLLPLWGQKLLRGWLYGIEGILLPLWRCSS